MQKPDKSKATNLTIALIMFLLLDAVTVFGYWFQALNFWLAIVFVFIFTTVIVKTLDSIIKLTNQ